MNTLNPTPTGWNEQVSLRLAARYGETYEVRKAARVEYYWKYIHGWRVVPCNICRGSGYQCGICENGKTRVRGPKALRPEHKGM